MVGSPMSGMPCARAQTTSWCARAITSTAGDGLTAAPAGARAPVQPPAAASSSSDAAMSVLPSLRIPATLAAAHRTDIAAAGRPHYPFRGPRYHRPQVVHSDRLPLVRRPRVDHADRVLEELLRRQHGVLTRR